MGISFIKGLSLMIVVLLYLEGVGWAQSPKRPHYPTQVHSSSRVNGKRVFTEINHEIQESVSSQLNSRYNVSPTALQVPEHEPPTFIYDGRRDPASSTWRDLDQAGLDIDYQSQHSPVGSSRW